MALATAALLFALLVYSLYALNLMRFPFDYDHGEGLELQATVLLSQGRSPYRDVEAYPFFSSPYAPLFHIMLAPFARLFGPGLWYGRLLGFLGSLLCAAAIAYAVYRDGKRNRSIALLAGLAFLSSNFVYHIGPLYRQHTMMVSFETLAIVLLAGAFPRRDRRGIGAALALLICAGYIKQLAAFSALAAIAWMFLRSPRRGLAWTAAFCLAGGVIFALLTLASGGQWWIHAIVANVRVFILDQATGLLILYVKLHGFLLIPALLLLIAETYFERLSLYSLWFVFTALLGGVGTGLWGAGDSYLATSLSALCILSGIGLSRALDSDWPWLRISGSWRKGAKVAMALLIPLLYLGYARATFKMPTDGVFAPIAAALGIEGNVRERFYDSASFDVGGYAQIGYFLTDDDLRAGHAIVERIMRTAPPSMSEDLGFSFAAGRDVVSNATQLRILHLAGMFEGGELVGMIEAQDFGIVILRALFYPPPVLEALDRFYAHGETIHMNGFDYLLLYPKPLNES